MYFMHRASVLGCIHGADAMLTWLQFCSPDPVGPMFPELSQRFVFYKALCSFRYEQSDLVGTVEPFLKGVTEGDAIDMFIKLRMAVYLFLMCTRLSRTCTHARLCVYVRWCALRACEVCVGVVLELRLR